MPERSSVIPLWVWVVGVLLVIGLIGAAALVIRVQYDLREVQGKLERSESDAARAAARAEKFGKRADQLISELEVTKTERADIQTKLDQARADSAALKTQNEDVQMKLDQANSEIAQLKSKLGSAQSDLQERQAHFDAVQNELTDTKRSSDEAKADVAKAKEQTDAVRARLDQANAEIQRLNTELEQTKAALPSTVVAAPLEEPAEPDTKTVHLEITPDQITWGPTPPGLPEGAQSVVLAGDPSKQGTFVIRINAPAGYTVPPHWHSEDENVTIISGHVGLAMGETLNKEPSQALSAGSFIHMRAGTKHYAWTIEDSIIQISGSGPFDITYVNPADDPRKLP